MGTGRDIVITAYGHDNIIDKIAVNSFNSSDHFYDGLYDRHDSTDAETYCKTINNLELIGNSWIFARSVSENDQYSLESFLPLKFDVILKLDNKAIQTMLRHIDSLDIAKALKGEKGDIKERIFSNMSKRTAQMLKEDMKVMPVPINHVMESRKKIISIIRRLKETGEIVIDSKGETAK
jgi:hypothetical protein